MCDRCAGRGPTSPTRRCRGRRPCQQPAPTPPPCGIALLFRRRRLIEGVAGSIAESGRYIDNFGQGLLETESCSEPLGGTPASSRTSSRCGRPRHVTHRPAGGPLRRPARARVRAGGRAGRDRLRPGLLHRPRHADAVPGRRQCAEPVCHGNPMRSVRFAVGRARRRRSHGASRLAADERQDLGTGLRDLVHTWTCTIAAPC